MSFEKRSFNGRVSSEVAAAYRHLAYMYPATSIEFTVYGSVASILHRVMYKHRLVEEIHMVIMARKRCMDGYPPHVRQDMLNEVACYERVLEQLRKGRFVVPARTISFRDSDF